MAPAVIVEDWLKGLLPWLKLTHRAGNTPRGVG